MIFLGKVLNDVFLRYIIQIIVREKQFVKENSGKFGESQLWKIIETLHKQYAEIEKKRLKCFTFGIGLKLILIIEKEKGRCDSNFYFR